jgi:hypothetical protein
VIDFNERTVKANRNNKISGTFQGTKAVVGLNKCYTPGNIVQEAANVRTQARDGHYN